MATDYGEKERAFIDGFKENTGRDLGEWMQAIAAAGLPHRNDIIDWLRHRASCSPRRRGWSASTTTAASRSTPARRRKPRRRARRDGATAAGNKSAGHLAATAPLCAAPAPACRPAAAAPPASDLEALLAKAKAYRPLAQHLLAQIKIAAP